MAYIAIPCAAGGHASSCVSKQSVSSDVGLAYSSAVIRRRCAGATSCVTGFCHAQSVIGRRLRAIRLERSVEGGKVPGPGEATAGEVRCHK